MGPLSFHHFVTRRLLSAALTLGLAVGVVFFVFELLADPATVRLGTSASPTDIAALQEELGLNRPLLLRLLSSYAELLTGAWGESLFYRQPVLNLIGKGLGTTASYALPAWFLTTLVSVLAAAWGLRRPNGGLDRILRSISTLLLSSTILITALLAHQLFAHRLALFPIAWPLPPESLGLRHLLLPIALAMSVQLGTDLRYYRALLLQESRSPHFDALRTRGLSEASVFRHLLRDAAASICTRAAHLLPYLIAGNLVIEEIFDIPGLGRLAVDALRSSDLPLMRGLTFFLGTLVIVLQFFADLLSAWLDPRLRK